jgi:hypothetical protein
MVEIFLIAIIFMALVGLIFLINRSLKDFDKIKEGE